MKITFLKSVVLRNRSRCGIALLATLISIWFALTPGAAQSKNQKRITSLQIGEVSEGSRVTLVSDLALNDYEAFRRGDRFYVRIPLADFTARQPGFRGDGFDDVQVQKVGDGVVVSFKLQPGATARVDQRSNRLDVIFSAPNKMARNSRSYAGSNRGSYIPPDGIVRVTNPQTRQHRQRDAAGPMPPGSPGSSQATRERVVSGNAGDFQTPYSRTLPTNPREDSGRRGSNRPGASRVGASSNTTKSEPASSVFKSGASSNSTRPEPASTVSKSEASSSLSKSGASPTASRYEPSPAATPATSPSYPALATSTPAASIASQPGVKSPSLTGTQNWKRRGDLALQWVKANRQSALLGALLLLAIVVVLAVLLFRRRKNMVKAKRAGRTLAQPKHSPEVGPSSPAAEAPVNSPASKIASSAAGANESTARPRAGEVNTVAVPVASANPPRARGIQENPERGKQAPEQAMARSAAVAAPVNQAPVPSSSVTGSSKDEDQEREVFEL